MPRLFGHSRFNIMLVLNVIGFIACVCANVLLVLAALNVIFIEPDVAPVMASHVERFYSRSYFATRRAAAAPFSTIEDTYLYFLSHKDMLMMAEGK